MEPAQPPPLEQPPLEQPPQQLPLTARWCLRTDTCVLLEVARTSEQQRLGLMQRPTLPPLHGMWFPFSSPRRLRFWMHNTLVPLDMLFLRDGRVIHIETHVPVCQKLPCPSYGPSQKADGVVELRAGEAHRLEVVPGQPIRIELIRSDQHPQK